MRSNFLFAVPFIIVSVTCLAAIGDDSPPSGPAANAKAHDHDAAKKVDTMKDRCKMMMEMHQKIQSEQQAMDAEIDRLLAEMNGSTGDKKIEAMSAIINRLVQQRKTANEKMATMHMRMMQHMMQGATGTPADAVVPSKSAPPAEKKSVHQH